MGFTASQGCRSSLDSREDLWRATISLFSAQIVSPTKFLVAHRTKNGNSADAPSPITCKSVSLSLVTSASCPGYMYIFLKKIIYILYLLCSDPITHIFKVL